MKIKYFAWIRERLGIDEEDLELPENVTSVGAYLSGWLNVVKFSQV